MNPVERCPQCAATLSAESPGGPCVSCLISAEVDKGKWANQRSPGSSSGAAAMPDGPATVIDEFTLVEKLGEGGFGVVWRARQEGAVHREVALKILKPGHSSQVQELFAAERQVLAQMNHPCIPSLFVPGTTPSGQPYFVMELIEGKSITEWCDEHRLGLRARLELIIKVCSAVQHAHERAVTHCDLKPANVLICWRKNDQQEDVPVPKVIDFGIAKPAGRELTGGFTAETPKMMGTLPYMSPEQFGGHRSALGPQTDVYSLGAILYRLLTGVSPIGKAMPFSLEDWRHLILDCDPPPPSRHLESLEMTAAAPLALLRSSTPRRLIREIRGELDGIVSKALMKERDGRYRSVSEFAEDLRNFLACNPVSAVPKSTVYRVTKLARKYRVYCATAAAILAFLGAAAWFAAWQSNAAAAARNTSDRLKFADVIEKARNNSIPASKALDAAQSAFRIANRRFTPAQPREEWAAFWAESKRWTGIRLRELNDLPAAEQAVSEGWTMLGGLGAKQELTSLLLMRKGQLAGELAAIRECQKDLEGEIEWRKSELAIYETLARRTNDNSHVLRCGYLLHQLTERVQRAGHLAEASGHLERSVSLFETLVAESASSDLAAKWAEKYYSALDFRREFALKERNPAKAMDSLNRAIALAEWSVEQTNNLAWLEKAANCHGTLAEILEANGDSELAKQEYAKALTVGEKVIKNRGEDADEFGMGLQKWSGKLQR